MKRTLKKDNIYFKIGAIGITCASDKDQHIIGYKGVGEGIVPTSLSDYLSPHSINSMNLVHFLEQCVIHSQYTKFEMI